LKNLDKIWSRIGSVTMKEVVVAVLEDEIEVHKSRLNPSHSKIDILYLQDTINVIKCRIKEIKEDGS
jgi:hypothetical protein|tara:strand:+ start:250 stop:450 length:201 start_codon:yes stop_codon:yes gene_type:complete